MKQKLFWVLVATLSVHAQTSTPWYLGGNTGVGKSDVIGPNNSIDFKMVTGGTEKMRITPAGDVGIGTTAPSNKLTVSGNADVTGNLGVGVVTAVERIDLNGNIHMPQSGTINLNTTNEVFIANPVKSKYF
jgi:hypothetical protein